MRRYTDILFYSTFFTQLQLAIELQKQFNIESAPHDAGGSSVLQCVAVRCGALQCVAVLQCVV